MKISAELRAWLNNPTNWNCTEWPSSLFADAVSPSSPVVRAEECFIPDCATVARAATLKWWTVYDGQESILDLFKLVGLRSRRADGGRLAFSCREHLHLMQVVEFTLYRTRRRSLADWKLKVLCAIATGDTAVTDVVSAMIAEQKLKADGPVRFDYAPGWGAAGVTLHGLIKSPTGR